MSGNFRHIGLVFFTLVIILNAAFSKVNAQVPSDVDTLKLENGSGDPGELVAIGVNLVNTFAVAGFSVRAVFDQNGLSVQSVQMADRTSDMNIFVIDTTDAGVVRVSGTYLQPRIDYIPPGSGDICIVNFSIDESAAPGAYPLEFQDSGFNTYENQLSDTSGLLMVIPVFVNGEMEVQSPSYADEINPLPSRISTLENCPNPFNSQTVLSIDLAVGGDARFDIYDILGNRVRTIDLGVLNPGTYARVWNGRDENNKEVASGVYCYTLSVDQMPVITKKMSLIK
jgi:hypothetical protein